jgi:hypothetical protein
MNTRDISQARGESWRLDDERRVGARLAGCALGWSMVGELGRIKEIKTTKREGKKEKKRKENMLFVGSKLF